MSYRDDEDLKIGDTTEDEDDLDSDLSDPSLDDDLLSDDEDIGGVAGLDGAEY